MDVSIGCQLMGLSISSRTPPVNQGRFRFPPKADRFIPFRRNSQDSGVKYEDTDSQPSTPDSEDNNGNITAGSREIQENVFTSNDRAISRHESVREAERRNERRNSTNSLDNHAGLASLRSQSCDDASPWNNSKSRVLNFFSPEYNAGRRASQGRRGSQVFSPTPDNSLREDELPMTPPSLKVGRRLPIRPEVERDLPDIRESVYCQLLSWGKRGIMAVAFSNLIIFWNPASEEKTTEIMAPEINPAPLDKTPPRGSTSDDDQPPDITAVEWDPLGTKLAIGNALGYIWLWKSSLKGNPMPTLRVGDSASESNKNHHIACLRWLPSAHTSLVFAGTLNGRIEAHNVKQSSSAVVQSDLGPICQMAVSGDGRYLAVATLGKRRGRVTIICTRTYRITWKFKPHSSNIRAVAWCPWQPWVLATGGLSDEDGTIKIWSVSSEKLLHQSTAGAQVTDLVWSENTLELISGHGEASSSVLIWPWNLSSEPRSLVRHHSRIIHLSFSPDGRKLATATGYPEELLCIWSGFNKDTTAKLRTPSSTRSPLAMCIR